MKSQEGATLKEIPNPKPTTPWKPASMLTVSGKDPAYRYRWVRKDLLDKRLEEGWEPAIKTTSSRIEAPETTIIDGSPLTSYITKRGLVLCRMPKETAQARAAYYKKMTDGGFPTIVEELREKVGVDPSTGKDLSYGNITIGRPEY
jgi:hypothetical protein